MCKVSKKDLEEKSLIAVKIKGATGFYSKHKYKLNVLT